MRKNQLTLVGGALLLLPVAAQAITMRSDYTDAQAIAYGAESQFQSVGQCSGASGVLIAPNWVLTAYHVAGGFSGNPSGATFTIGGNTYNGAQVVNLAPAGMSAIDAIVNGLDLTLIRLSAPVVGITPAQLYMGNSERGNLLSAVGFGLGGNGNTGQVPGTGGIKRAMRNKIDEYFVATGNPGEIDISPDRTGLFASDFDSNLPGNNSLGTQDWVDYEGNLASGDSGGGVFIEENGQFWLAGVNSAIGGGAGYGDVSFFTSAGFSRQWIQDTTGVPEPGTMALVGIAAVAVLRKRNRK